MKLLSLVLALMMVCSIVVAQDYRISAETKTEAISRDQLRVKQVLYDKEGKEVTLEERKFRYSEIIEQIRIKETQLAAVQAEDYVANLVAALEADKAVWEGYKADLDKE